MKLCPTCGREYPEDKLFCEVDGTALRGQSGADLVGSVVAERYHITKKLGEGGMGAVYLGEHVKMGRESAIKVISQSMAQDADAIARFNREAANAARINHPNVCGIYDFGETTDGLIYLAMEFIEGGSLTDLLKQRGALAPQRAALILQQTADALQAAHDLGIVHRDLKPDNIMITHDRDGSDFVKVVDFGIAKAMGGDEEQKVTKTGLVVGTPEYMSPEQLSGDKLDGRSDIYALGLVLFRMLTGTLPFQAETAQEMMIKRLTDEPMRLNDAIPNGSFPAGLQLALDRALQRMPSDRYESAAQFGRDVLDAVASLGTVGGVDTESGTQLFDTGGNTALGAAIEESQTARLPGTRISAQAPATVVTGAPTPATPAPTAATQPMERPPKKGPAMAIAIAAGIVVVGGTGTFIALRPDAPGSSPDTLLVALNDAGVTQDTARSRPGTPDRGDSREPGAGIPAGDRNDPVGSTTPRLDQPESVAVAPDEGTERPRRDPPNGTSTGGSRIAVEPAGAEDHLYNLFDALDLTSPGETQLRAMQDTARAYFDADVTDPTRALAAYVMANILATLQDRSAVMWADSAVRLDPSSASYRELLNSLRGTSP